MTTASVSSDSRQTDQSHPGDRLIGDRIETARAALWRRELTSACLWLVLATILIFILWSIFDQWVWASGRSLRLLIWAGLVIGGVVWIRRRVWPLFGAQIDTTYAAYSLEQDIPELKHALTSYVTLRNQRDVQGLSGVVVRSIGARAADRLHRHGDELPAEATNTFRLWMAVAAAFAALGLYAVVSPKNTFQSTSRLLLPLASIDATKRVRIREVSPANVRVISGDPIEVLAKISGLDSTDEPRVRLSLRGSIYEYGMSAATEDQETFSYTLGSPKGIESNCRYKVLAGDAETEWYQVTIDSIPVVRIESVSYQPPSYTGLPRRSTHSGPIEGLEGSRVTISATTNRPVTAAQIEFNPRTTGDRLVATAGIVPMTIHKETGRAIQGHFDLFAPKTRGMGLEIDSYCLRITDTSGTQNPKPVIYPIRTLLDLAPEVTIVVPVRTPKSIPVDSQQMIEVHALDPDYGLTRLELQIHRGTRLLETIKLWQNQSGDRSNRIAFYRFRPQDLGYRAGDIVNVHALATDNRVQSPEDSFQPNVTQSAKIELRIEKTTATHTRRNDGDGLSDSDNQPAVDPKNQSDEPAVDKASSKESQSEPSEQQREKGQEHEEDKTDQGQKAGQSQKADQGQGAGQSEKSDQGQGTGQSEEADQGQGAGQQSQSSQGTNNNEQQQGRSSNSSGSGTDPSTGDNGSSQNSGSRSEPHSNGNPDSQSTKEASGNQSQDGSEASGGKKNNVPGAPKHSDSGDPSRQSENDLPQTSDGSGSVGKGRNNRATGKPGNNDDGSQKSDESSSSNSTKQNPAKDGGTPERSKDPNLQSSEPPRHDGEAFERIQQYIKQKQQKETTATGQAEETQKANPTNRSDESGDKGLDSEKKPRSNSGQEQDSDRKNSGKPDSQSQASDRSEAKSKFGDSSNTSKTTGAPSDDENSKPNDPRSREGKGTQGEQSDRSGDSAGQPDPTSDGPQRPDNRDQGTDSANDPKASPNSGAKGAEAKSDSALSQTDRSQESATGEPGSSSSDQPSQNASDGNAPPSKAESKQGGKSAEKNTQQPTAETPSNQGRPTSSGNPNSPSSQRTEHRSGGQPGIASQSSDDASNANHQPDPVNLEHTKKATDMVLDYLKQTRDKPDRDLLERLNWTEKDLERFTQRWNRIRDMQHSRNRNDIQEFQDTLKSLGMRDSSGRPGGPKTKQTDGLRRLKDSGTRRPAPALYRDAYDAFRRSVGQ